jgi:hypothetical protein
MQCLACQHDNPPDASFCGECARLEKQCPSSGERNRAGAKFCRACGQSMTERGDARTTRVHAPTYYTPRHLAERILTSRSATEGERKQVTVLFADLKGSMELLAERDAEEARKILDPVLEQMVEPVHRYEGTVNQIMGDGIMEAQCHLALGELAKKAGEQRDTQERFSTAASMFREMGMQSWLEKAESAFEAL